MLGIIVAVAPATPVVPAASAEQAQAAGSGSCASYFRPPYDCIRYAPGWHSDYGYPGIGTEPSRIVSCPPGNAGRKLAIEYTTNITASGPAQRRRQIICNFYGGAPANASTAAAVTPTDPNGAIINDGGGTYKGSKCWTTYPFGVKKIICSPFKPAPSTATLASTGPSGAQINDGGGKFRAGCRQLWIFGYGPKWVCSPWDAPQTA